ncbi:hypothetical protein HOJ01_03115 [bacterium]|jgi:hypothetical protein|nr:hypothetical protein [bacterium]MBT6293775.1 hypothetical protein [bacterium]
MENHIKTPPKNIKELKTLRLDEIMELKSDIHLRLSKRYEYLEDKRPKDKWQTYTSVSYNVNQEMEALNAILKSEEKILKTSLDLLSKSYNFTTAYDSSFIFHNTKDHVLQELAYGGLCHHIRVVKHRGQEYMTNMIPKPNIYKGVRERYLIQFKINEPLDAIENFEQFRKKDPEIAGIAFLFNFDDFEATNQAIQTIKK